MVRQKLKFSNYQLKNGMLGLKLDNKKIKLEIEKMKKSLNLTDNHKLIDENDEAIKEKQQIIQTENQKLLKELQSSLSNLNLKLNEEMNDVLREITDETSLINELAGQFFQSIPHFQESRAMGKGVGQNKKQAKTNAAINALKLICPDIYEQWKAKFNGEKLQNEVQLLSNDANQSKNFKLNPEIKSNENTQNLNDDKMIIDQAQFELPYDNKLLAQTQIDNASLSANSATNIFVDEDDEGVLVYDCKLDDPQLMTGKKHLCEKYTPLTVIKALEGKHKKLSFQEAVAESKDLKKNVNVYTCTFQLKGYDRVGTHTDFNKNRARQMAAQKFLKALFPTDFTWKAVERLVQSSKEPLRLLLDL
ncbi:UNKNOWN [Stylonychia lemnae]|uniref:DRBM domain-containing protein n=1 Tax=Stylonychia lemnae TaxID=5949 RepID=A0A078B0X8_STYLE|nr:UNKNOWN [Stylonychia lemnae]|eukprot:CDW88214.1 UNKNOWN [Stylonychia lemnae]